MIREQPAPVDLLANRGFVALGALPENRHPRQPGEIFAESR